MNNNNIFIIVGISLLLIIPLSSVYAYNSEYNPKVDMIIKQGLEECFTIHNNICLTVMQNLDNKCQVEYYSSCFISELWTPYMGYLEQRIEAGNYPDEKYKEDPYLTLNNHHYGNSNMEIFN